MKHRFITAALTAATLLLGASLTLAAEDKSATPAAGKASTVVATPAKKVSAGKRSAPALAKPVDINKASIKELKRLPGVTDDIAARMVAGRPYPSKADLVTRNIIDTGLYSGIRQSVVAKQPFKDGAKNAALYTR